MGSLNRFAGSALAPGLLTTLVFIAAACGGSAPLPSPTTGSPATLSPAATQIPPTQTPRLVQSLAPETAPPAGESESVFVELLGSIPNTLETRRWVLINDYARAREIFNIQLPGPTADADEFGDYLLALSADVSPRIIPGPFISGFTESAFFNLTAHGI